MTRISPDGAGEHPEEISTATGTFRVSVTAKTDPLAVVLHGELDVLAAPLFVDHLATLAGTGARDVVVDLGGVTFLDSTGAGALVDGLRRLRAAGGDLSLRAPRPPVKRVLELLGLTKIFRVIYGPPPDEVEALQHEVDHLRVAVDTRDVIGQAKGILMDRLRVTADEAFDQLLSVSQDRNVKLREVAHRLAETGEWPPP